MGTVQVVRWSCPLRRTDAPAASDRLGQPMARSFATLERFFERLLERPAARLFRARLQPVQLQRRLERAMESRRVVSADRTYVPNRYRVLLHPADLETFDGYRVTLETDLAEALLRRARSRGYRLVARPEVYLLPSGTVSEGDIDVDADVLDPSLVRSAAAGLRPVGLEGPRPPRSPIPGTAPVLTVRDGNDPARASAGQGATSVAGAPSRAAVGVAGVNVGPFGDVRAVAPQDVSHHPTSPGGADGAVVGPLSASPVAPAPMAPMVMSVAAPQPLPVAPPRTAVAASPVPPAIAAAAATAMALIEVRPQGTAAWNVPFRGGTIGVGRGADNEIVLIDERVSRHHGRFTARQGTLVYTDLGSTNGSFVGRAPVREIALGVGDVVRVGSSTLTIRPSN